MKDKDSGLYKSAEAYSEVPEGMKNEVQMWFISGGLLMQELSKRMGNTPYGGLRQGIGYLENQNIPTVEILDVCSGLSNFVNHLSFFYPNLKAICLDNNAAFLDYSKRKFNNWEFITADAVNFSLGRKFDIITASSAYHHIKDGEKLAFLRNLQKHLSDNGVIIVCENFLPDYHNDKDRDSAIVSYYKALKDYFKEGNSSEKSLRGISEVEQLEIEGKEEYKVPFRIFKEQLEQSSLMVDTDIVVWQPKHFFEDNAGSHVIILKKNQKLGQGR